MITATRRLQFCAGHRIQRHESKCRNLHGHNYVALFTARGIDADLDQAGRVIDFSVLKDQIGGWIDKEWDHGFVLHNEDHDAIAAVGCMTDQKLYLMDSSPTAENMAKHLLNDICPRVLEGTGVKVVKVVVWETENCEATAEV